MQTIGYIRCAAIGLSLGLSVTPALAQTSTQLSDQNAQEIRAHILGISEIQRLLAVQHDLNQLSAAGENLPNLDPTDETEIPKITEVARRATSSPKVMAILRVHAFNAADYAAGEVVLTQNLLALMLLNGGSSIDYVEKALCANRKNIELLKSEECQRLLRAASSDSASSPNNH